MKKLTILLIALALSGCASVYGRDAYTARPGKDPAEFEHDMKQCKRRFWLGAMGHPLPESTVSQCMEARGWCHLC